MKNQEDYSISHLLTEGEALAIAKAAARMEIVCKFPALDNMFMRQVVDAFVESGWECHKKFLEVKNMEK